MLRPTEMTSRLASKCPDARELGRAGALERGRGPRGRRGGGVLRTAVCALVFALTACGEEKPPAPGDDAGAERHRDPEAQDASADAEVDPSNSDAARLSRAQLEAGVVLTYPGDRGVFHDVSTVEEVPTKSRGFVRVTRSSGGKAPAGQVWVTNLGAGSAEEGWALEAVPRELFEELALGRGNRSQVELPEGLELPEVLPPAETIIVYKTAWCGVCKQLQAYLDRKGVEYETKDIEKDPQAAAELQAKAAAKGVPTGSVPVIDIDGELLVGFDRARLESML